MHRNMSYYLHAGRFVPQCPQPILSTLFTLFIYAKKYSFRKCVADLLWRAPPVKNSSSKPNPKIWLAVPGRDTGTHFTNSFIMLSMQDLELNHKSDIYSSISFKRKNYWTIGWKWSFHHQPVGCWHVMRYNHELAMLALSFSCNHM